MEINQETISRANTNSKKAVVIGNIPTMLHQTEMLKINLRQ